MATIPVIAGYLQTQLAAVSSAVVKTVIKGFNQKATGFPYVRYYFDGPTSEQVDGGGGTASDYRTSLDWVVEVVGEQFTEKTSAKKEDDLQDAVEGVLAKLEEEYKLAGDSIITGIVSLGSRAEQLANGYVRVISFRVTVKTFRAYV